MPVFIAIALMVALLAAGPAWARAGVTSTTSGDPMGQPPAEQERILRVGMDVQANERVTTNANDRAHLVFLDGTSLSVGPNSSLVIDKFVFDPDSKKGELSLNVTKGVLRLVGGSISKSNAITVNTQSASIGIRGGIATFEVAAGGATTASFLYGDSMKVTAQGQTQTATRHGSQIHIEAGRPPSVAALIPPRGLMAGAAFEKATTKGQATSQAQVRTVAATAQSTRAVTGAALDRSGFTASNSNVAPAVLVTHDAQHQGVGRGQGSNQGLSRNSSAKLARVAIPTTLKFQYHAQRPIAQNTAKLTRTVVKKR